MVEVNDHVAKFKLNGSIYREVTSASKLAESIIDLEPSKPLCVTHRLHRSLTLKQFMDD